MDSASVPSRRLDRVADEGLRALFLAERAAMLRVAVLLVGSPSVAEEVVQDAFATVAARWSTIDRPGAYLRTTVVNGCRQVLRRRAAEGRAMAGRPSEPLSVLPERLVEVHDALGRLSERQRIVVVLRYVVDLTDDEIAATLDVRPSTVRSLARRALIVLRRELA